MDHLLKMTTSHNLESGFCEIRTEGEFTPKLVQDVNQTIQTYIQKAGLPLGILLDVRRSAPLSMARVSTALDMLSRLTVPLAVVFLWPQQLELAHLLHHTLPHHDKVAYFTDLVDACKFLTGRTSQN